MAKVAIPADESYIVVKAALGDERVGKLGLELLRQNLGSQDTGPLPVTLCDLKEREILEQRGDPPQQLRIAQQFREDDRRQTDLAICQRLAYQLDVLAGSTGEEGDPGAGIDSDHRSSLSCSRSIDSATLPLR